MDKMMKEQRVTGQKDSLIKVNDYRWIFTWRDVGANDRG